MDEKDKVLEDIKDFNLDKSASFTAGYVYCEDGSHAERKDKNYKSSFDKASKVTIAYEDSIFYSASWKNSSKRYVQY